MSDRLVSAAVLVATDGDGVERSGPGSAPVAFRIWKSGANATDMGVHVFSADSARALMAEQERRGNQYSIDCDHLSLDKVAPPESRKAVGWHRLAVRPSATGPELWAVDVEWTDAVRPGLEQAPPEWKYFSPAYKLREGSTEIISYLNTALTNNPATHSVTQLAARASDDSPMSFEEMVDALFGDEPERRKEALRRRSLMSDAERKKWSEMWRQTSEELFAEEEPAAPARKETTTMSHRSSTGNPTLARLTRDERAMLASLHADAPPPGDIVRATRRGTTLEMPMHIPTATQIANRIKELEADLAAHRADMAGGR